MTSRQHGSVVTRLTGADTMCTALSYLSNELPAETVWFLHCHVLPLAVPLIHENTIPIFPALEKLISSNLYPSAQTEAVSPSIVFDLASLVLYDCQAIPIRIKILLDRLFSSLQHEEVLQILHGFGWSYEDYARGYIVQVWICCSRGFWEVSRVADWSGMHWPAINQTQLTWVVIKKVKLYAN